MQERRKEERQKEEGKDEKDAFVQDCTDVIVDLAM